MKSLSSTIIKLLLLVLPLVTITTAQAQLTLNNSLTEKHAYMPGTRLSIIPPHMFYQSKNFRGFYFTEGGRIEVLLSDSGVQKITNHAATYELSTGGHLSVDSVTACTVNGYNGVLISGQHKYLAHIKQAYVLVFGTDSNAVIIEVDCDCDEQMNALVKKALLSVVYEPNRTPQPFNPINFTIDVTGTGYAFESRQGAQFVYLAQDDKPLEQAWPENLFFVKATPLVSPDGLFDGKEQAKATVKELFSHIQKFSAFDYYLTEDLSGYEVIATGKDNVTGKPQFVYGIILYGTQQYSLMGMAADEKHLAGMKKAFSTFKVQE